MHLTCVPATHAAWNVLRLKHVTAVKEIKWTMHYFITKIGKFPVKDKNP